MEEEAEGRPLRREIETGAEAPVAEFPKVTTRGMFEARPVWGPTVDRDTQRAGNSTGTRVGLLADWYETPLVWGRSYLRPYGGVERASSRLKFGHRSGATPCSI